MPLCICDSNKSYEECCKPYHEGKIAENALKLMRSRYSAYALHLADYIMQTTHPDCPLFEKDFKGWKIRILDFAKNTKFEKLEVLRFKDGEKKAVVTFVAHLRQGEKDVSFTEESHFVKEEEQWFYLKGEVKPGRLTKEDLL